MIFMEYGSLARPVWHQWGLACFCLVLGLDASLNARERIWRNDGSDRGAIHALGNGEMCAYGLGPGIMKLYPGPLSTPSMFTIDLVSDDPVETKSLREKGTAIWTHHIFKNGAEAGRILDLVDAELPVLVRQLDLADEVQFALKLNPAVSVLDHRFEMVDGRGEILLMAPAGTVIYQKYVYPRPLYFKIAWQGKVGIEQQSSRENEYLITCGPGKGELFFVGGPEYSETVEFAEKAQLAGIGAMIDRTRSWWMEFSGRRRDFENILAADLPLRAKMLQTIDDCSVMLRAQQSSVGACMAGYPYPLGYVRDQYGISRGLLALGYYPEARRIMEFYWDIWRKTGELHCAQGIGVDGIFHIHENDEVESTAYLILQAFDLQRKTGDEEFTRSIFPMLQWCWEVQKKHLAGHMLPFNGDETYVAGGILPRWTLNDGSAEATLLFVEGGEKLLQWIKKKGLWTDQRWKENAELLADVRLHFRENFWDGTTMVTNNPTRLNHIDAPRFRHGVCERKGPDCVFRGRGGFAGIDWLEKDANNRYQCPVCLALGPLPAAKRRTYKLISVSLTPLYFESGLFKSEELAPLVNQVYDNFHQTGILTSRTDAESVRENKRSVGYDYGLILDAMIKTDHQNAEEVYRKTLSIVDETGVWSEYYLGNIPSGTRCRPWESGINLEALIEFAVRHK